MTDEEERAIYDNYARIKSEEMKAERAKHEYLTRKNGHIDFNDPEYQTLVKLHEDTKIALAPWKKRRDELQG